MSRIFGNHSAVLGLNELHFFGTICGLDKCSKLVAKDQAIEMAAKVFAVQERDFFGSAPSAADLDRAEQLIDNLPES